MVHSNLQNLLSLLQVGDENCVTLFLPMTYPPSSYEIIVWLVCSSSTSVFMLKCAQTTMMVFCFNYSSFRSQLCVQTTSVTLKSIYQRPLKSMSISIPLTDS